VHVWIKRAIPPPKFAPRDDAIGDSLTADQDLPHGRILATATDKAAKLYSSTPLLELCVLEYRFGGN
jgi:hypothetical protein